MDDVKKIYRGKIREHVLPIFPIDEFLSSLSANIINEGTPHQVLFAIGLVKEHPEDLTLSLIVLALYIGHVTSILGLILEPLLCVVLPTWEAFRSIEQKQYDVSGRMLLYFICFGFLHLLEGIFPIRVPMYPYMKSFIAVLLYHPESRGVDVVEQLVVEGPIFQFLGLGGGGRSKRASMSSSSREGGSFVDLSKLQKVTEVEINVRKVLVTTPSDADEDDEPSLPYVIIRQTPTDKPFQRAVYKTPLNPKNFKQAFHVNTNLKGVIVFDVFLKRTFGSDPAVGSGRFELDVFQKGMKKVTDSEVSLTNDEGDVGGSVQIDVAVQSEPDFID